MSNGKAKEIPILDNSTEFKKDSTDIKLKKDISPEVSDSGLNDMTQKVGFLEETESRESFPDSDNENDDEFADEQ